MSIRSKFNMDRVNKIKFFIKQGNLYSAEKEILDYLVEYPNDEYVKIQYGIVLTRNHENEKAKKILLDVSNNSENKNNRFFALARLGRLYSYGDNEEAKKCYLQILKESDQDEIIVRNDLAKIYCYERNYTAALSVLTLENSSKQDYLFLKKAATYISMGKYDEALMYLNKIKKLENCYGSFEHEKSFLLGKVYFYLHEYDLSVNSFNSVLKTGQKNKFYWKSYLYLARINLKIGEVNKAIKMCNVIIDNNILFLEIAKKFLSIAYIEKGEYEKSKELFKEKGNNDYIKLYNYGRIELAKSNYENSEKYLSKSYFIKNDEENLFFLALVKFKLQKYDESYKLISELENAWMGKKTNLLYEAKRLKLCIAVKKNKNINDSLINSYAEAQIVNYKKERALKHIISHHKEDGRKTKFSDNIDIEELFDNLEFDQNRKIGDSLFDKYNIDYDNIGTDLGGNRINQLMVITLPNTTNIITMYPYLKDEKQIDLNEEKNEYSGKKDNIKRLTQIEKFNKRYGNK